MVKYPIFSGLNIKALNVSIIDLYCCIFLYLKPCVYKVHELVLQTLNITEQVEQMTVDMSTVEVISQDTIDQLNQFSAASDVNYTAMYLVVCQHCHVNCIMYSGETSLIFFIVVILP